MGKKHTEALWKRQAKTKAKRGPKPDVLKLEGNWKDAVKKSLKKKPPTGFRLLPSLARPCPSGDGLAQSFQQPIQVRHALAQFAKPAAQVFSA